MDCKASALKALAIKFRLGSILVYICVLLESAFHLFLAATWIYVMSFTCNLELLHLERLAYTVRR